MNLNNEVLRGWLERDNPQLGDMVAIQYRGDKYQRDCVAGVASGSPRVDEPEKAW